MYPIIGRGAGSEFNRMHYVPAGEMNLQSTLSASSANAIVYAPHHPITCVSQLRYHEDGSMECDHVRTKPDCERTQTILDHTIAILLFEEAWKKFGEQPKKS